MVLFGLLLMQSIYRPCEVDLLLGDASKAKEKLGWKERIRYIG